MSTKTEQFTSGIEAGTRDGLSVTHNEIRNMAAGAINDYRMDPTYRRGYLTGLGSMFRPGGESQRWLTRQIKNLKIEAENRTLEGLE